MTVPFFYERHFQIDVERAAILKSYDEKFTKEFRDEGMTVALDELQNKLGYYFRFFPVALSPVKAP